MSQGLFILISRAMADGSAVGGSHSKTDAFSLFTFHNVGSAGGV